MRAATKKREKGESKHVRKLLLPHNILYHVPLRLRRRLQLASPPTACFRAAAPEERVQQRPQCVDAPAVERHVRRPRRGSLFRPRWMMERKNTRKTEHA